jgi:hypothetical protein
MSASMVAALRLKLIVPADAAAIRVAMKKDLAGKATIVIM